MCLPCAVIESDGYFVPWGLERPDAWAGLAVGRSTMDEAGLVR